MSPDRLKQLRSGWEKRRGSRTVLALLDAIEAADRMRDALASGCGQTDACYRSDPCTPCRVGQLYDAAKARI